MKKSHWSWRCWEHAKKWRPLFGPVFFTVTNLAAYKKSRVDEAVSSSTNLNIISLLKLE
jgi:hypothetical protein